MGQVNLLGLPELRTLAALCIEDLNDERLGVVAEAVGAPPIVDREVFREYVARGPLKRAAKVIVGVLMLSEFVGRKERKALMDHYGLDVAKIRKERSR